MSRPGPGHVRGVRLLGTGACLPRRRLANTDLMTMMDTTDEWIVQRTGISTRHISDPDAGETTHDLGANALRDALAASHLGPNDLDLILCATMTGENNCPPVACMISQRLNAGRCGAMDLSAACCSWVYALNTAAALVKTGAYNTVGVVGVDRLSKHVLYSTEGRSTAILFGDGAGAAVIKATDDPSKGIIAQSMHSNGERWTDIFIPWHRRDIPCELDIPDSQIGKVHMNGAAVFKFAVSTFPDLIAETLEKAGLRADEVDMYVCHQSNARILKAARERFGLPEDKLYINIDRVGNTVSASVPLCLHELRTAGKIKDGQRVMFVAFGAGLTWGSSLWQL